MAVANFMSQATERSVSFDPSRMILTSVATAALEMLTFCLADSGNAFLVPTPYDPGLLEKQLLQASLLTHAVWKVNPKWVVYHSMVSTDMQYMRNVISIDPTWLTEAAPQSNDGESIRISCYKVCTSHF